MSVMLLTVVTIYRDSDANGTKTQIQNITKGAEYHISGAKVDLKKMIVYRHHKSDESDKWVEYWAVIDVPDYVRK